ncbi:MAG: DUF3800 domain-containing protein [Erysipelotrichaceae bacterium]|nr:DUF3800 domain-containing protein [Erysipelotrichaceae bacterium]
MKKQLSIYIDETGDFGPYDSITKIYGVAFVLCEDLEKCDSYLRSFFRRLQNKECGNFPIHVGPLIRREGPYSHLNYESRLVLFDTLFDLLLNSPISILDTKVKKSDKSTDEAMAKALSILIRDNIQYFHSFDKITIYYDNGQSQLRSLLLGIFSANFLNYEMVLARQSEHPFMQVADLAASLSLLDYKVHESNLSNSENEFFAGRRKLKKIYLACFNKKKLR